MADALIILEVLGPQGEVRQRLGVHELPLRIGRAYDNDLILDDDHVSPAHAELTRDADGELLLLDRDSLNGLRDRWGRPLGRRIALDRDETLLNLGMTTLRLRRPHYHGPQTRPVHHGRHTHRRYWLTFALLAVTLAGLNLLDTLWSTSEPPKSFAFALGTLLLAVGVAVWGGIWGLISRISVGRPHFLHHLNWTMLTLIAFLCGMWLRNMLVFAFNLSDSALWLSALLLGLWLAWELDGHLRYANQWQRRFRLAFAALVGIAAAVSLLLTQLDERTPGYNTQLSPLRQPAVPAQDLDEWLKDIDRLDRQLNDAEEAAAD